MEKWFSDPDFENNRKLFNKRKDEIKALLLDEFINNNYPQAYSKFFNDMLKTRRVSVSKIIETLHPSVDVSQLLNLGMNDDHMFRFLAISSVVNFLSEINITLIKIVRISAFFSGFLQD